MIAQFGVMRRWLIFISFMFVIAGAQAREAIGIILARDLPPEAQTTLQLIKQGGPFPYEKDGVVFANYEKILPKQKRGYYYEYTVKTPRARNRGARRIVAGGPLPGAEYFYTADHYQSFQRIQE